METNITTNLDKNQTTYQDPMLAMIERVCTDPSFDIQKMEKIIEMRNCEMERIAKKEFNQAFSAMQEKLPKVITNHKNNQTHSKYAKIEDINNVVLPILSQYGFGISFKVVDQTKDAVSIRAILKHSSGYEEFTDVVMPFDKVGVQGKANKTDIHATGSTITYAKRYAMCMILNISTGDDNDGNNNNLEYINEAQVNEINALLDETQSDKITFTQKCMKAESIPKILARDYRKALNLLEQKKNKMSDQKQ